MFSAPTVVGDSVFIGSCSGKFYCLDKNTGALRWSYNIHQDGKQTSFHGNSLVDHNRLFIGTDGEGIGHVYAFDTNTGKVLWKYAVTTVGLPIGRGVPTDIVGLGPDVYAATMGDQLLCLDRETGHLVWSFQKPFSEEQAAFSSAPAVAAGRVYFGALNGSVYALDAGSGRVIWARDLKARVSTSPLVVGDSVYVGDADSHIYRLNRENGEVTASLKVESMAVGHLVQSGHLIFASLNPGGGAGASKALICTDLSLGKVTWSRRSSEDWTMARPFVWRKAVLAGDADGQLFAFGQTDGAELWSHKFDAPIRSMSSSGEILYIGTLGGTVYAYHPEVDDHPEAH